MAAVAEVLMLEKLQKELDNADDMVLKAIKRRRAAERRLREALKNEGLMQGFSMSTTFRQARRLMGDSAVIGDATFFTHLLRGELEDSFVDRVILCGANTLNLWDEARAFFGHEVDLSEASTQRHLIERVCEEEGTIGVLSWVTSSGAGMWWSALNETRFKDVRIVACWPSLGEETPNIAIVAKAKLVESGDDDTLLMAHDEHYHADRLFRDLGFQHEELVRARSLIMVRVTGFIEEDDPRLEKGRLNGLDELRVVGALPRL